MKSRFGKETWSLTVPRAWNAWHEEECSTLVDETESCSLQISSAFQDTKVTDQDLLDLASDHIQAGAIPEEVKVGDFLGLEIAFSDTEYFYRQWYVSHKAQVLFITYTGESTDPRRNADVVNSTLDSLRAS